MALPTAVLVALACGLGAVGTARALAGSAGPALVAALLGTLAVPMALRDVLLVPATPLDAAPHAVGGDGVEPLQVSIRVLVVLVVVGGSAAWVTNRRRSTTESRPGAS